MKKLLILLSAILGSGCAINTTTETIVLDDGSKVCTWGQAGFLIPSMAGARDCNKQILTNYATSQQDIGTTVMQEAIRGATNVWAADIIANGLSKSGDVVNNTASGGAGGASNAVNANANFNVNKAAASATAKSSSAAMSTVTQPK